MVKEEKKPLDQAWKDWIECLKGDDINSIFRQITLMIWDSAIFRLIIESRQIQIDKNPNEPAINGELHSFINRNYFQSQVSIIRRLVDKSYRLIGPKAVYSIYSLISDIYDRRNDLTREALFRTRNMSYDFAEIQHKEREFIRKQSIGKGFVLVSPELDSESIAETHQAFDRLSGKTQMDRQPNDVISERIFARLKGRLDDCRQITNYVDKFVAHSATPESRATQNDSEIKITLKQLWDAHRIIFEVAEFLSVIFFSESHMALAIENPSLFQYWSIPLLEEMDVSRIRNTFEEYRKETERWNQDGINNIWNWIDA
jgi:hypothetical protein